jgi:hypothetical protein
MHLLPSLKSQVQCLKSPNLSLTSPTMSSCASPGSARNSAGGTDHIWSAASSRRFVPRGLTRGYDRKIPYFPLAEPGLGNESGESSPQSKPLGLTRGYDEKIPYFPLAEPGLGNESGESSPHSKLKPTI